MAQKKKSEEQDVLVVRDEKTGEISVVAGLGRDGTPKRTPANAENSPDFLRFDRNSDMMDSFFRNFYRQYKEPSRFEFYRISARHPSPRTTCQCCLSTLVLSIDKEAYITKGRI